MGDAAARELRMPNGTGQGLHSALARLAAAPEADLQRANSTAAGQVPLTAALLQEIAETVLPREVTVLCGGKPVAVLFAAQRRLAGFTLGSAGNTGPGPDDPAAAVRIFARRLQTLQNAAGGGGFRIRRRPCKAPEGAGSCTVQQLNAALAGLSQHGPLEAFRNMAEAKALAWSYCGATGQPLETWGPEDLLSQLDAVRTAAAGAAGHKASLRLPEQKPDCILLPVSGQVSVIAASSGGASLIIAVPAAAAAALLAEWQSLFPGTG